MQTDNRAEQCAKSCFESIRQDFEKLDKAAEENNEQLEDSILREIDESAYGVDVEKRYSIILAGGGPAVRIHGTLDNHNEPKTACLQYQDWFTPWEEYKEVNEDLLLRFAQRYCFEA